MFFIPLNQIESVELVIHALRAAGGEADCSSCPARKVCMKQCLSIADAVARMAAAGTLPSIDEEPSSSPSAPKEEGRETKPEKKDFLKVVK